jgi:Na+-driven multidrug efflux pump
MELAGVEIMQPLAGLISTDSNAAQTIIMNMFGAAYTIFMSFTISTSIFTGYAIGEDHIESGKLYTKVSMILVGSLSTIMLFFLMLFKNSIIRYYTSDPTIIALAKSSMIWFCLSLIPDSLIFS